jgi:hypothetical protein
MSAPLHCYAAEGWLPLKNQFLIWRILLCLQIQFIVSKYKNILFQHLCGFIGKINILFLLCISMIHFMGMLSNELIYTDTFLIKKIFNCFVIPIYCFDDKF